ncbi:hypothetical protein HYN59_04175 [Flavobacterium album]|uniref:Uncharacterized protein n=1 Tax=Flavobacterium album TaxID=2175091 RepID=A0A2S1QVA3_9FLAO|nr:hypothetical protein [Flavobacterium album]AWH84360.1 hypothetical protein HYN59_04175 [Flavobacterium album]
MKFRIVLIGMVLLSLSSCALKFYNKEKFVQPAGLDFSQGKWLLGPVKADPDVKDEIAAKIVSDFSKHLKGNLKYSVNERSIILPKEIPLNPDRAIILDLKTGTGSDYFINVKCESTRKNQVNFEAIYQTYYIELIRYAKVTLEVYDLNRGEMVYSQSVYGKLHEATGLSVKPKRNLIMSCYKEIAKEIRKKYSH